ncbi:aldose 1-epimerase (plasmid) [Ensifer adhaerens]|uniref:aldose 1-epimerase n=1 Tax=Ensifer adhaerens TaxID=106592 RepID=UPI0023AA0437|nr:aldose 1-epimerase [Ensifer adhaerens]WDZ79872.1 aldose 1-epimerase [Ensifer adhaerens]
MAGDVLLLENDEGLTVEVSPLGGAILSARWRGIPVLAPTPAPGLASQALGAEACFPLVPFGNRIEDNGFHFDGRGYMLTPNTADPLVLHGDGWLERWSLLHQDRHSLALGYSQEADAATPFAYETLQTITIDGANVILSLTVTSRAAQTLPYGLGFHPYFPRTPGTRLFARAERYWTERENHLPGAVKPVPEELDFTSGTPLPPGWLNNAFDGWDGKMRVEWPESGLALSLDADESLRFFVLYSPSADADFFCFEPMSHRPNAHRQPEGGGLVQLAPGEALRGTVTLRVHELGP